MESDQETQQALCNGAHSSEKILPEPSETSNQPATERYKTYIKRSGTIDKGKEYEILMCALYALKFGTSDDVEDFEMSTNNEECGDFDDIKIEVTYKDGTKRLYLFQLKHKHNKTTITEESLCALPKQNNKLGLFKYFEAVSKETTNREAIIILYTNCTTNFKESKELVLKSGDSVMITECSNMEYVDLLSNGKATTEKQFSIFQFELTNNQSNLNQDAIKQFYLFVNQIDFDEVKSIFKKYFEELVLRDISRPYIHFIQDWYFQRFVLTKHDLITKVTELALSPYIKVLSGRKCIQKSKQLQAAIMDHEMTLIENSKEEIIENIWEVTDDYRYSISDLKKFGLTDATDDGLEMQKTKLLWHLNVVPLIVKIDDANKMTVLKVLKLLKTNLNKKKIVLVGNVTKTDFDVTWTIFEKLSDFVNNCQKKHYFYYILSTFYVSLQGKQEMSLQSLIELDKEMAAIIGVKELLQMSQQNFLLIGNQKMKLPDSHIPRTVSTITLNIIKTINQFIQLEKCIVIINCDENFREKVVQNLSNVMELPQYLTEENNEETSNLILLSINTKCTCLQFDQICNKSPDSDVYLLQIINDKSGSLLLRKGNQLPLDLIKYNTKPVEEKDIFGYLNHPLNVVCAPPGMGKSTLLTSIYNSSSSEYWCIYVNLINHNSFLNTCSDPDLLWEHLLESQQNSQDPLFAKTVNVFLKNKKVQLFLDGLDEVDSKNISTLLSFIKHVSSEKANVWVSSRENLREKILESLNIVPLEIEELDHGQQMRYIYDRLQSRYNFEEIETLCQAIFDNANIANNRKMLGIPLQLYILTENFLETTESVESLKGQNSFVLTNMYRQFFSGRNKFAYQKLGMDQYEYQLGHNVNVTLKLYEIPALQACLDKTDFDKLKLGPNGNKTFIESLKTQNDKYGIIKQINAEGQAVFEHQTYAEYFACVFLRENLDMACLVLEELLSKKYENLRIIFDIMLGEESPLHLAIIYKREKNIEENIEKYNVTDRAGRRPLHLLCSYGMNKYPPNPKFYSNSHFYEFNPIKRESKFYVEFLEWLCSHWDPSDCHDTFGFNLVDYSLRAHCLYPIEKLLGKGFINPEKFQKAAVKYYDAETLVYYSCQFGYPQILSCILPCHSDILNSPKFREISLLDIVIIGSIEVKGNDNYDAYLKVLQHLISFHINIDQRNRAGCTPLQFACQQGSFDIVQILLEGSADINARDNENKNALHYAFQSKKECKEVMLLLINSGIDVNAGDKSGKSALHLACEQGNFGIIEALLTRGSDINALDNDNKNALHYALHQLHDAWRYNTKVVELLISRGINLETQNKYGRTALHVASKRGYAEIVQKLLERGANINTLDKEGKNALHYAAYSSVQNSSNEQVIELLISHGIGVNVRHKFGKTPLHVACERGHVDIVKELLERGADVNALDNDGINVLHYAIFSENQNEELIELLLKYGLALNTRNKLGQTVLHIASKRANLELVKKLVGSGADVNAFDEQYRNALHYAAQSKSPNTQVIEFLINKGTSINAENRNGSTPLLIACQLGTVDNMLELIHRGANTSVVDKNKNNVLHLASLSTRDSVQKISFLQELNLDLNAENVYGMTAIHFAFYQHNPDVVKLLIERTAPMSAPVTREEVHHANELRGRTSKIFNFLRHTTLQ